MATTLRKQSELTLWRGGHAADCRRRKGRNGLSAEKEQGLLENRVRVSFVFFSLRERPVTPIATRKMRFDRLMTGFN